MKYQSEHDARIDVLIQRFKRDLACGHFHELNHNVKKEANDDENRRPNICANETHYGFA